MRSRIYYFFCINKLINTNKFGFCSKHLTKHALISSIKTIKKYIDNGETVCEEFLDLPEAVNHERLLKKIK